MDPIEGIKVSKDSTFAMLLEAQERNYEIHYMQASDMFLTDDKVLANASQIQLKDQASNWFKIAAPNRIAVSDLDAVLMRKDPPFNMEYIYNTYLLDRVQETGTLVINHPTSLRNANEKLFATQFSNCITPYIAIFKINHDDANRNVILETITQLEQRTVMAQKLIPEYVEGDKRVLLIDGEPIPFALLRVPSKGELRANLAKGGSAHSVALSARDRYICEQIKPALQAMQLSFVGIDIIGEYLTEINVTSPTGIRELDKMHNLNISATLLDHIEKTLETI